MSRIIIKGLSEKADNICLYNMFSQYGKITDVKIFKNKNGKPRGFCFIGFSTLESANIAIEKMNGIFIYNKKVFIEKALPRFNKNRLDDKELFLNNENTKVNLSTRFQNSPNLAENISQTGTLYIRNIPKTCKKFELEILFRNFGYIEQIAMPLEEKEKSFSTYAYVKFGLPECAITAAAYLDGKIFQGRIMHIVCSYNYTPSFFINRRNFVFNIFRKVKNNLDFETSQKLGCTDNLISNYRHLNINLGKSAITEGRIQNEAFLILKKEGINLNSFDPALLNYKSQRILLIKNLPIQKKKSLYLLLKNFGHILKYVVLPLTGLILIEFKKKNEALLAYQYLEKMINEGNTLLVQWAPLNCFKTMCLNTDKKIVEFKKKTEYILKPLNKFEINKYKNYPKKDYFERKRNFTKTYKLLVKNIPFSTKPLELVKIFNERNKIVSIRIPRKKDGNNRGFCFVEFCSLDAAKKALVSIQNVHLGKRRLFFSIIR
nr:polyadenylate-binding protein [Cryptomonas sp.]